MILAISRAEARAFDGLKLKRTLGHGVRDKFSIAKVELKDSDRTVRR